MLSRNKKIVLTVVCLTLIVIALLLISLFILQEKYEEEINIVMALDYAGIEKTKAYGLAALIEYHYEDIKYFIDKWNNDRESLMADEKDFERLNSVIISITDNIGYDELGDLLYALAGNNEIKGLNGIFAAMKYYDGKKIERVLKYRITADLKQLDLSQSGIGHEDNAQAFNIKRDDWRLFTKALYEIGEYVVGTSAAKKVEIRNNLVDIINAENVVEEVSFKNIIKTANYIGKGIEKIENKEIVALVIGEYFLDNEYAAISALANTPVTLDVVAKIMSDVDSSTLTYILGDYPKYDRVLNNIFVVLKSYGVDSLAMSEELSYYASATFDEDRVYSRDAIIKMFNTARNIDEEDFTSEEKEFFSHYAYYYIDETNNK